MKASILNPLYTNNNIYVTALNTRSTTSSSDVNKIKSRNKYR